MTDTGAEHAAHRAGFGPATIIAVAAAAFACGVGMAWLILRPPLGVGVTGGFHDPAVLFPAPAGSMMSDAPPARAAALPDVETMIASLASRLEAAPDDPAGWKMLGWSYYGIGRFGEAAVAYARAAALLPPDADLLSLQGEALVRASDGRVGAAASTLFAQSLALDPRNARSTFYSGVSLAQEGKPHKAVDLWLGLLARAPPDAAWLPDLRNAIRETAAGAGIDLSEVPGLSGDR